MIFLPQFLNQNDFYQGLDDSLLSDDLLRDLRYIARHWDQPGRPLIVLLVDQAMLQDRDSEVLLSVVAQLQSGEFAGVRVRVAPLARHLATSASERIDYLHDFRFPSETLQDRPVAPAYLGFDPAQTRPLAVAELTRWELVPENDALCQRLALSKNLYEQLELLRALHFRIGLDAGTGLGVGGSEDGSCTVRELLEELYQRAAHQRQWAVVRRVAGLLDKASPRLVDALTELVLQRKRVGVGRSFSRRSTLSKPAGRETIIAMIREFVGDDERERILTQEIILLLGSLITSRPALFDGMLTLRIGHLMMLLTTRLPQRVSPDRAIDALLELPPHRLAELVTEVMTHFQESESTLLGLEVLHRDDSAGAIQRVRFSDESDPELGLGAEFEDWRGWREHQGVVGRLPESFFSGVWALLQHCNGIVIGDKLNRKRRLVSSEILAAMTPGEPNFALRVEDLLNKIQAPIYRQLTIEALNTLMVLWQSNPELHIGDDLVLDVIIGHAVRLHWQHQFPGAVDRYEEQKPLAWQQLHLAAPHQVANSVVDAVVFLLESRQTPLSEQDTPPS